MICRSVLDRTNLPSPIRVLHVVENFNGQAVESWLTRMVNFTGFDFKEFQFDFFLIGIGPGRNQNAILEKGCQIHQGNPDGASIPKMAKRLRECVKNGKYDIVHVHQDVMAGVFALALAGTGVKLIAHVHNCWQRLPVGGRLKEKTLTAIARQSTLRMMDAIVGVSKQALDKMTGGRTRRARFDRVIYCSAQSQDSVITEDQRQCIAKIIKESYGLPESATIILFMGRLDEYKNPIFALDVFAQMVENGSTDTYLIIAGVGGLVQELQARVTKLALESRVRITGWIENPGNLLLASDLLLIPSQESYGEGLGLAAVEAQSCAVPVLCSLSIPEDAKIIPDLFHRRSLNGGIDGWSEVANSLLTRNRTQLRIAKAAFDQSHFCDDKSYDDLANLYKILTHEAQI